MYDWKGVRFVAPDRTPPSSLAAGRHVTAPHSKPGTQYLEKAPRWDRQGVEAYEKITSRFVFFLDSNERAKDPHFQELQLRARDGKLTADDAQYIREHMDASRRGTDFSGPEVYRLVQTRRQRDEFNALHIDRAMDAGSPSILLQAINSSTIAAEADEDKVRAANELCLTIGARVMVIHNLCVAHGLVNGTVGFVHDVACDSSGKPVAVLVTVKRRSDKSDGYSGPSFLDKADGVDMKTHAIVAIGLYQETVKHVHGNHVRTQFPLMLVRPTAACQKARHAI